MESVQLSDDLVGDRNGAACGLTIAKQPRGRSSDKTEPNEPTDTLGLLDRHPTFIANHLHPWNLAAGADARPCGLSALPGMLA